MPIMKPRKILVSEAQTQHPQMRRIPLYCLRNRVIYLAVQQIIANAANRENMWNKIY